MRHDEAGGRDPSAGASSSQSHDLPADPNGPERATRGPDQQQRVRITWTSTSTGEEKPNDWSNFDISSVTQALRVGAPGGARLLLRKLHIRLWHASAQSMSNPLKRVGMSQHILDMIPDIVNTCSACRAWVEPQPASIASVGLTETFNDQVEAYLICIYNFIVFHVVGRCTRWHATRLTSSKEDTSLIHTLEESWTTIHGPMHELTMGCESGVAKSQRTQECLKRRGIKFAPRAPGQHARIIERRGALLSDAIHRIDAQLKHKGIDVPSTSDLGKRPSREMQCSLLTTPHHITQCTDECPDYSPALTPWKEKLRNM